MNKITIWDLEKSRKNYKFNNDILIWKNIEIDYKNEISLHEYLNENSDKIKNKYLKLISDFGNIKINNKKLNNSFKLDNDYSLWWSSLINEKCNYQKSKELDNFILYLSFIDWVKKHNLKELELYSENKNLLLSIKNWCKLNNVKFIYNSKIILYLKSIFNFIYYVKLLFFPLIWNIYFYIKCIPYKLFKKNNIVNKKQITLVSYLLNYEIIDSKFKSKYWTSLIDKLKDNNVFINFIHIGMNENFFKTFKQIKELKNIKTLSNIENHTFLSQNYDFITFVKIYLLYFIKVFETLRIIYNLKSNKKLNIEWNFICNDFYQSFLGVDLMKNIINYNLYKKHLSNFSKDSKCIYLFENQNWEISLLYNWKKYINQEIIGFSHSTVRYWDLRYFFYKNDVLIKQCNYLFPKLIAANGDYAMNLLKKSFPTNMLCKVESLRYLYLSDNQFKDNKFGEYKKLKILVLTDFDKKLSIKQLKVLNNLENFNKDIKLIIKAHPGMIFNFKKYLLLNHYVTDKHVDVLFDDVDIVYTSSFSSVAVEAYFRFKKVICYLDPSGLNLSPLLDFDNVDFIRNYKDLSYSIECYLNMKNQNNKIENYFYLNKNLNNWMNLLL
ncbi:MAG: hypothetical protein CBB97_01030 [Candidatus Endolissoclinum sp. TMED37]|nr:MAG: hypothetical protein CBB97_01030 [Candidatus Endolissoclinum sp. TMED37]